MSGFCLFYGLGVFCRVGVSGFIGCHHSLFVSAFSYITMFRKVVVVLHGGLWAI